MNNRDKQLCKFYPEGRCRRGENCSFIHSSNVTTTANFTVNASRVDSNQKPDGSNNAEDRGDIDYISDKLSKVVQLRHKPQHRKQLRKVNTESFEPSYAPPDMRVIIAAPNQIYSTRDIIIAPNLFDSLMDVDGIYDRLLDEIDRSGTDLNQLWKSWHGDTHWIADDHLHWKKQCPTFTLITDRIASYFNMDVKATRLNHYKDNSEWKPFHFDAAAIDPKKAEKQNMTIGVSFGATREISFEHSVTKTRVSIPLGNGSTYGFSKTINIEWRHGVPKLSPEHSSSHAVDATSVSDTGGGRQGRISIIAWGYCNLSD